MRVNKTMSIIEPKTGVRYSLRCNTGKQILKSYVKYYQKGGGKKKKPKLIEYFKNQTRWFSVAEYKYNSINEIDLFQKKYENNESFMYYDGKWEEHITEVINFMGNYAVWKFMLDDKIIFQKTPPRSSNIKVSETHRAYYTGHHWLSIAKGTQVLFDPYEKYQIKGTNQFCQTYALMNLLDRLPGQDNQICKIYKDDTFEKYYYYTKCALKFILEVARKAEKNQLKLYDEGNERYLKEIVQRTNYLYQHSNLALNLIKMPPKTLRN